MRLNNITSIYRTIKTNIISRLILKWQEMINFSPKLYFLNLLDYTGEREIQKVRNFKPALGFHEITIKFQSKMDQHCFKTHRY